jgi:hypothetical protein
MVNTTLNDVSDVAILFRLIDAAVMGGAPDDGDNSTLAEVDVGSVLRITALAQRYLVLVSIVKRANPLLSWYMWPAEARVGAPSRRWSCAVPRIVEANFSFEQAIAGGGRGGARVVGQYRSYIVTNENGANAVPLVPSDAFAIESAGLGKRLKVAASSLQLLVHDAENEASSDMELTLFD